MSVDLSNLALHPKTREHIVCLIKFKPQGIMLIGKKGSGKNYLTNTIASQLLEFSGEINNHPYFMHINPGEDNQEIPIESIRSIIKSLGLKVPGKNKVRRIIFIEDAHRLSIPAQNALLKVLEEPNPETIFILSLQSVNDVLPTISSRMQHLNILPLGLDDSNKYWAKKGHSLPDIEKAWRLSGGAAGLISLLLNSPNTHPLSTSVAEVKDFLRADKYHRLLIIDRLGRNKEDLENFLDALGRTLSVLHHLALTSDQVRKARNLAQSRRIVLESHEGLSKNVSSKLLGINLVLKITV